ncbi:hypothetical protein ABH942_002499 [Flavobacterium sp. 28YEA47A]|uniref:hypothetical protein n=1 Tax=Flavobacterium sp. 28YEA47A TaxID=3156276 RepID=UPI003515C6AF
MSRKSEILHYIQEYKDRDSDYWALGNGNNELFFILIRYTENSWLNLQNELENWDLDEKEILANALSDEQSWHYIDDISSILNQRSLLFSYIFSSIDTAIAYDLFDNDRVGFIFKGERKPLPLLIKIQKKLRDVKNSFPSIYNEEKHEVINNMLAKEIDFYK